MEAEDEHLPAEFAESGHIGVEAAEHDEGVRDRMVGTGVGCHPYVMLPLPPRHHCLPLEISRGLSE